MLTFAMVTPSAEASDPTSLTCTFKTGRAHTYAKGQFKPVKASALKVEIGDIDADKQSAVLKGSATMPALRMVRAVNAMHFIEVVGEGYLNVTTVYDPEATGKPNPAVHSRHFGVLGQPVISHYLGSCIGK